MSEIPSQHLQRIMFYPPVEEEYGFSAIARVGKALYLSGVIGHDAGAMHADPERQYELVYRNLAEILATQGATLDDVVLERVYQTSEMEALDPAVRRRLRGEAFGSTFPAATWIAVEKIGVPGAMIEVEVMAVLPERD